MPSDVGFKASAIVLGVILSLLAARAEYKRGSDTQLKWRVAVLSASVAGIVALVLLYYERDAQNREQRRTNLERDSLNTRLDESLSRLRILSDSVNSDASRLGAILDQSARTAAGMDTASMQQRALIEQQRAVAFSAARPQYPIGNPGFATEIVYSMEHPYLRTYAQDIHDAVKEYSQRYRPPDFGTGHSHVANLDFYTWGEHVHLTVSQDTTFFYTVKRHDLYGWLFQVDSITVNEQGLPDPFDSAGTILSDRSLEVIVSKKPGASEGARPDLILAADFHSLYDTLAIHHLELGATIDYIHKEVRQFLHVRELTHWYDPKQVQSILDLPGATLKISLQSVVDATNPPIRIGLMVMQFGIGGRTLRLTSNRWSMIRGYDPGPNLQIRPTTFFAQLRLADIQSEPDEFAQYFGR